MTRMAARMAAFGVLVAMVTANAMAIVLIVGGLQAQHEDTTASNSSLGTLGPVKGPRVTHQPAELPMLLLQALELPVLTNLPAVLLTVVVRCEVT